MVIKLPMKLSITQEKINFIKTIKNFEKINAFLDLPKINEIKLMLIENGFYKNKPTEIKDSSIVNLIIKAQGKKPMRLKKERG